jgi:hypothetical protein
VVAAVVEGPSRGAMLAAAAKKRKLGTTAEGLGASDRFAMDLLGTCAAPGERMSSPKLRESSARMLKVTGGRRPRSVLIPRAAGEDMCMSRLAREMKIFPYGWNVAAVVSAVMEKDRPDSSQKHRAFVRVGDPRREVKMARGIAKSAAPGTSKPPLGTKSAAPGPSKLLPAMPAQERRPPSPPCTAETEVGGAEVSMDISMDDYLVGGSRFSTPIQGGDLSMSFFTWSGCLTRLWCRVGGWATGCCPGAGGGWVGRRGDWVGRRDDWGKGVFVGPMVEVLRQRRDRFGRRRYKDVAGSVVQQLKHVSSLGLRQFSLLI